MISVMFRFPQPKNRGIAYVGFAFADDYKGLFWEIDRYGDPWQAQIRFVNQASCCMHIKTIHEMPYDLCEVEDAELSDDFYDYDEPETVWLVMDWKTHKTRKAVTKLRSVK